MNVWNLAKGLGVVIVGGAIAFSGNSTIAEIDHGANLKNNLNALKINHSIKQTQFQNRNSVDKKKTLVASCFPKCI